MQNSLEKEALGPLGEGQHIHLVVAYIFCSTLSSALCQKLLSTLLPQQALDVPCIVGTPL